MKIKVLDGLRGYAALFIVIAHFPTLQFPAVSHLLTAFIATSKLGYLGVDIFFVLSGFLITRILIKDKKNGTFSLRHFYWKRTLRIFPIYYLCILICGLLFTWEGSTWLLLYISNYYFTWHSAPHPMSHAWSLAVEEQFYLVWPTLFFFLAAQHVKRFFYLVVPSIFVLSILLAYSILPFETVKEFVYRGTQFRIISLSFGAFFACYESAFRNMSMKQTIGVFCIFTFCYALGMFPTINPLSGIIPKAILQLILFSVVSAAIFLLVLKLENTSNYWKLLFTNRFITYVGKISYGLYLYHHPILYFFGLSHLQLQQEAVLPHQVVFPTLLMIIIPIISYQFIEMPLLKLKDARVAPEKSFNTWRIK